MTSIKNKIIYITVNNYIQMDPLIQSFISLSVNDNKIIRIQKVFRGYNTRLKRLSTIIYAIKNFLKKQTFQFSTQNEDGIYNCIDEHNIINLLTSYFGERIKKPQTRMWYDILAYDYKYGWLPIKTTCDNTGNLAMCVYAYTNELLDIHNKNTYNNGSMSKIFFNKIKNKEYNIIHKKDYYFIVLDKKENTNVIVNSVKGLTVLTPNINNLPFQIRWSKNNKFTYKHIKENIKLFVNCLNKTKMSWREQFITNMKTIEL